MLYRTICVCLVGFVLATSDEKDPLEITFKITTTIVENRTNIIYCDHKDIQKNIYTVLEGGELTIITKYISYVNHVICSDYNNYNKSFRHTEKNVWKNVTIFKVEKRMGTLWNCTLLTNRDNPRIHPNVQYKDDKYKDANYSAAYCFMKIHVRHEKPPQTILVNNMVLQAVRTDLSEKDVDFTAEYRYADGDVVNVTCANFLKPAQLTMEYTMAGTKSDNSTMADLSSANAIGFVATLHSGHNNSYMICTMEQTDYTKVMVRFVMRTEFNIVSIKINGMTQRPKVKNVENHYYEMEYKYRRDQLINVVCGVQKEDMTLVLIPDDVSKAGGDKNRATDKEADKSFYLNSTDIKNLQCSAENVKGGSEERVSINFSAADFPIDQYSLQMKLPSSGTAMELYSDNRLKIIFYEFEDGETLQLNCGPLVSSVIGPVLYLHLNNQDKCKIKGCAIPKSFNLTSKDENTVIACCLKEQKDTDGFSAEDKVLKEIRVILRKRVLTTTTSTTTTSSTTARTTTAPTGNLIDGIADDTHNGLMLAVISGAVLCIIIICVSTVIVKLRKRNHSQGGPHDRNYQNLQSPSETSIPVYPPQWESNYAVPVDRRAEDTTYSVPCQEPALYSTPIPKNLRNKKQKPDDPTYAFLDVPNAQGRKNIFKETDDPNYSEVYANIQEQCYAKVLPKGVRNKMAQDNNPYSYVTNDSAYANSAEPEPMYCEPAKAQGGTYANLNNAHYANSNTHEYVEPTYCEPHKRMK